MGCINSKNRNQSEQTNSQGYDDPNCEKTPPVTARSHDKKEEADSQGIEMQEFRSNAGELAEVDTGQNNKANSQLDATSSNAHDIKPKKYIKKRAKGPVDAKSRAPPAPSASSGTPEHHRSRKTDARKVDKLKTMIDDLERRHAENEHKIEEEQKRSERLMREKKELKKQIKAGKNKIDHLGQTLGHERTRLQDLETELDQIKTRSGALDQTLASKDAKIHELEIKLEQTKIRLSQYMATRLTDNNPNIADLSDPNRPTKLAEYYSELYDNQWTEAYAELEDNRTEEETCLLLDILLVSYEECRRQADQDLTSFMNAYKQFCKHEPSAQITKLIKQERKRNFQKHTENMNKVIENVLKKKFPDIAFGNNVLKYVKRCTELCWLMVIQDPLVHVDTEVQIAGQTFNKDKFRHYTEYGEYVKYVVWPVLYLMENGAVLSKGIAQGMRHPIANESVQDINSDTSECVDTTQEPARKGPNKADKVENIKSTH